MTGKILLIASAITTLCLCLTASAGNPYPGFAYEITYYSDAAHTQVVGSEYHPCPSREQGQAFHLQGAKTGLFSYEPDHPCPVKSNMGRML